MRTPQVSQGAAPRRPAAAAAGTAPVARQPRQQQPAVAAAAAAPSNDILRYEVQLLHPTIIEYVGQIKSAGELAIQMYVRQPGSSSLRLQDFPAKTVLTMVTGREPNTDRLQVAAPAGRWIRRLILTGYEGIYTVFVNDKGETFRFRTDSIFMQSDKGNAESFGVTTGNKSSAQPGAAGGRAGAPRRPAA